MAGAMQPGHGPPIATEYTLQGVMRFLQTEWHRHERDRNAWEIERQEMKGRIAMLEGQARRSDATQKALHRYLGMLQVKMRERGDHPPAQPVDANGQIDHDGTADRSDRKNRLSEKLNGIHHQDSGRPAQDADAMGVAEDESQRVDLRSFLEHCHSELGFLTIAPANPLPPRESPPLPFEDSRDAEAMHHLANQPLFPPGRFHSNNLMEMAQRIVATSNPSAQSPMGRNGGPLQHQEQPPSQLAPSNRSGAGQPMYSPAASEWDSRSVDDGGRRQVTHTERPIFERDYRGGETPNKPESGNDSFGTNVTVFGANTPLPPPPPASSSSSSSSSSSLSSQSAPSTAISRPDTDVFPSAENPPPSPGRSPSSHRRKGSMSRRRSSGQAQVASPGEGPHKTGTNTFALRYGLRGHLGTVRTVIFSGGGSPGEPEICTAGDDGMIKRFMVPRLEGHPGLGPPDPDVPASFTHRGHTGMVLSLASWPPLLNFSTGGRALGDGWIFSGGADGTIRVWERGRVEPKATLEGHSDAVWVLCTLPATLGSLFGPNNAFGPAEHILLASGSADGTVRIWAVSAPPQLASPQPGSVSGRAGVSGAAGGGGGRSRGRGNSMSSGSAFPATPQPSLGSSTPCQSTLIWSIPRSDGSTASPTAISPLSPSGETFVVSYSDAAVLVFDTRTGEVIGSMASLETYDNTNRTAVTAVAATTVGFEQAAQAAAGTEDERSDQRTAAGPTGSSRSMAGSGVEGTVISGHEDKFIRFYDANSGQCTYSMVAHPDAVSSISLSPDGRELVSAGHDASLRFWDLERRSCTQTIWSHGIMRGEGVCAVVWSQDGHWVVSCGGDGIVKVFAR